MRRFYGPRQFVHLNGRENAQLENGIFNNISHHSPTGLLCVYLSFIHCVIGFVFITVCLSSRQQRHICANHLQLWSALVCQRCHRICAVKEKPELTSDPWHHSGNPPCMETIYRRGMCDVRNEKASAGPCNRFLCRIFACNHLVVLPDRFSQESLEKCQDQIMGSREGTILILSSCIQTNEWTDQNTPRRSLSVNMSMSDPFAVPCRCI